MATKNSLQRSEYKKDPSWLNFIEWFRRYDGLLERNEDLIWDSFVELLNMVKGGKLEVRLHSMRIPVGWVWRTKGLLLWPLGKIEVVLYRDGDVRINAKTLNGGLAYIGHPNHGSGGPGDFCLGSTRFGVGNLIDQKEFALALDLVIQYLKRAF